MCSLISPRVFGQYSRKENDEHRRLMKERTAAEIWSAGLILHDILGGCPHSVGMYCLHIFFQSVDKHAQQPR